MTGLATTIGTRGTKTHVGNGPNSSTQFDIAGFIENTQLGVSGVSSIYLAVLGTPGRLLNSMTITYNSSTYVRYFTDEKMTVTTSNGYTYYNWNNLGTWINLPSGAAFTITLI